ncbi:MAG: AMP nucleosidase [Alphaproteobacteria bacterium]
MIKAPKNFKAKKFKNADDALAYITQIYDANVDYLQECFRGFAEGSIDESDRITACYPYIRITSLKAYRSDSRHSYGFVSRPGTYSTTLTRPDIFDHYYKKQIDLLIKNHGVPVEVGVSDTRIPIHFALGEHFHLEKNLDHQKLQMVPDIFDIPDLDIMDDEIPNATFQVKDGQDFPLALFTAPRADISLQRLKHYCGSAARHFQNYIIFTNYQFYIDEFVKMCSEIMAPTDDPALKKQRLEYEAFVQPGDSIMVNRNLKDSDLQDEAGTLLSRLPQMPAYHLTRSDGSGITMINIGVGPSNAKTITDHVSVLRPHAYLMLGHCAGLRNSQNLGDYVLAHGYLREDNILDGDLPPSIPIPALAEIQQALEKAVAQVTGYEGYELKKIMRTGTVATTDDRNWELRESIRQNLRLSQSRAIAMDMESGTIAANGFRFRVPYGTLLCVSDKPLHGQLKLPGMADTFYRERVEQHLQIGLLTMRMLRDYSPERLHSRKLRSFNEVAFQ